MQNVLNAIRRGHSPLILTEQIDHLDFFTARLQGSVKNLIVLRGSMGVKQRRSVMNHLERIPAEEDCVLLATGRNIGEGFDNARLDTLFLAMPFSWMALSSNMRRGSTGSIPTRGKSSVYDYTDDAVPMLAAMFGLRLRGYEAAGYSVEGDEPPFFLSFSETRGVNAGAPESSR